MASSKLDGIEAQLPPDLIERSLQHLVLLHAIDTWPNGGLYEGRLLEEAVRRYECVWLNGFVRLHLSHGETVVPWEPPLDVAFIWHVHRLDPRYPEYCKQALGRVVVPLKPFAFTTTQPPGWPSTESFYPPRPTMDIAWSNAKGDERPSVASAMEPRLVEAVKWQAPFGHMFLRLCYHDRTFLELARQRYVMFLNLARAVEDTMIVPMYDIDLMWHTHISMNPAAYPQFYERAIGRPFQHDDETLGKGREAGSALAQAYEATKRAWGAAYEGEPYALPGTGDVPPHIMHPVAAKFAMAQGYLGYPQVQRTGAWALHMQFALLALLRKEELKLAKGGLLNRLKRGTLEKRQQRAYAQWLLEARKFRSWQHLPHDSDHPYCQGLLDADVAVLVVGCVAGPGAGPGNRGEGAATADTIVPVAGAAQRQGEQRVFEGGDDRWDRDQARQQRLQLYKAGFLQPATDGLALMQGYTADGDSCVGCSAFAGPDGHLDADCLAWVDRTCTSMDVPPPLGNRAYTGGRDGGRAYGGPTAAGCGRSLRPPPEGIFLDSGGGSGNGALQLPLLVSHLGDGTATASAAPSVAVSYDGGGSCSS